MIGSLRKHIQPVFKDSGKFPVGDRKLRQKTRIEGIQLKMGLKHVKPRGQHS